MMSAHNLPTIDRLREVLEIDAEGVLRWTARPSSRVRVGDEAMTATTGPREFHYGRLDGVGLQRARVVFALTHGRWPVGEVRHLNGDHSDDSPDNLVDPLTDPRGIARRKTAAQRSKYIGVFPADGGGWKARRCIDGKTHHLGNFTTAEAAARAYDRSAHTGGRAQFGQLLNFPDEAQP